jgi:DNA invertase Pin-like site-specific DNA recombinase
MKNTNTRHSNRTCEGYTGNRVFAYLRVSTLDQDVDKFKADILSFANTRGFIGRVTFVEEKISGMKSWKKRKLADLVSSMQSGDILIVPELSRLGRSLVEVLEVLNVLKDKDVAVYSVKENFQLNGSDMQSKVMRTMLGLFAEIEHDLIVARTKEGLQEARSKGRILGRPRGSGKSKLDPFKVEIESMLKNGVMKTFIARKYGISQVGLWNWLVKHGLDNIKPQL